MSAEVMVARASESRYFRSRQRGHVQIPDASEIREAKGAGLGKGHMAAWVRGWPAHSSYIQERNVVFSLGMKDPALTTSVDRDLRCECGRMVARIESRGIVIKCNRCGEFVVIDLPTLRELVNTYEMMP